MNANEFYAGLDQMFEGHDNAKTEQYMLDALTEAQATMNFPLLIAVSNELGGFYRASGKREEAMVLSDSVLEALKTIGQGDGENYAVALINSGNTHNAARDFQTALNMYKEAEEILERNNLNKDYRMAALCNNISALYREIGNLDEAERMAQKSIVIISDIPESRLDLATSLINLGEVQTRREKYADAEKSLLTAKAIYENEVGGNDIHYAASLAALGVLEYYRKNYDASIGYYEQALAMIERDFGRSEYYTMMEENLAKVKEEKAEA